MPQASAELNAKFTGMEDALAVLKKAGISHDKGDIRLPAGMYPKRIWDAIDYLCFEWDFALNDAEPMVG